MAIFVFFAWMMEAAVALGIVEPDPTDPASRAHRTANAVMECLKEELIGTGLEYIGPDALRSYREDGSVWIFVCRDGELYRKSGKDGEEYPLVSLGEGGAVTFCPPRGPAMTIVVDARTEDGGEHKLEFILRSQPKENLSTSTEPDTSGTAGG